jgi:hypothetical protein
MPDKNKIQLDESAMRLLRSIAKSLERLAGPKPKDETGVKRLTEPYRD